MGLRGFECTPETPCRTIPQMQQYKPPLVSELQQKSEGRTASAKNKEQLGASPVDAVNNLKEIENTLPSTTGTKANINSEKPQSAKMDAAEKEEQMPSTW